MSDKPVEISREKVKELYIFLRVFEDIAIKVKDNEPNPPADMVTQYYQVKMSISHFLDTTDDIWVINTQHYPILAYIMRMQDRIEAIIKIRAIITLVNIAQGTDNE